MHRQETLGFNALEAQSVSFSNIHWFKWDSTEIHKLDPLTGEWTLRDIKVKSKFLFFSSVVHLPNEQGCLLLGGSDNEDNYSKRV